MVNKIINEKHNLVYDDRRKELTLTKYRKDEFNTDVVPKEGEETEPQKLLSTDEYTTKVVYTEEGIRMSYGDLSKERAQLEKNAADLKKGFEEFADNQVDKEGKMQLPEDLKELRDKLVKITKFNKAEQAKANYEAMQERLKEVNRDIDEIKEAVGSRLKF